MKIIDILNKIANNEETPKKILYEGIEYEWWESEYCKDYHNDIEGYLIDSHIITDILNNEVEILEITIHNQNKMGFVNTYVLCDSDFERKGEYSLKATEIIDRAFEEYSEALNEIIKRLSEDQE